MTTVHSAPLVSRVTGVDDVEDWLTLLDHALQGVHHALNNRIGTLSALVELTQLNELPPDGSAIKAVAADLGRLEECNRVVHLLPREHGTGEEPLMVDDVLTDVFAIHRFLHDVRDVPVTAPYARAAEPVRVERWALVRVLTLLLYDARRLAKRLDTLVRTSVESDEQWVRVDFRVGENGDGTKNGESAVSDVPTSLGGRYAELVGEALGGSVVREAGVVTVRLPTLKARRAREVR